MILVREILSNRTASLTTMNPTRQGSFQLVPQIDGSGL